MQLMKRIFNFLYRILKNSKRNVIQLRYGSCAVLLYHRVVDLATDPQLLAVSPKNFDKQLNILKSKYNLLTISEFENLITTNKKIPNKSVVITFDDGYADNFTEALPILEKHKAQAIFYISTGNIETNKEFWWDELERLLLLSSNILNSFIVTTKHNTFNLVNNDLNNNLNIYDQLLPILRSVTVPERNNVFLELRSLMNNKEPRISHRSMNEFELEKFSQSSNVTIGAHTQNHPSLAALSENEQLYEIESSKSYLENLTGKKIEHFSYPFGTIKDYNNITESICKKLEFKYVAANYPALVNGKTSNYNFPRFLVRNWDENEFEKELTGFFKF